MTGHDPLDPLPPRVDALLSGWAAGQRLDLAQATAIRAAILADVAAPAAADAAPEAYLGTHLNAQPDAQWWLDLAGQTNRVIARSMRRRPFPRMPRPLPLAA